MKDDRTDGLQGRFHTDNTDSNVIGGDAPCTCDAVCGTHCLDQSAGARGESPQSKELFDSYILPARILQCSLSPQI
ncbi:hypothetical protein INR49_027555 [Caranx melampygus]|nr:hypothetical protein INR49_027555 [Caranx melampygus]